MATLNLDSLKVVDTDETPVRLGRPAEPNPFVDVIADSFEKSKAKTMNVPYAGEVNDRGDDLNIVKVTNMIRAAAKVHGLGVSIQVQEHSKTLAKILFIAQPKRNYERKTAEDATPETVAE